jgi:O-antigen/teichoic acid export membrane protein
LKSAFLWSFASNYIGIIVQLISTMVLARLMTPSEIGTYAIAGALFAIGQMFRNMGVSTYLIRESSLTARQIEAALFIVCSTCIIIAFALFVASEPVAIFYELPSIEIVLKILAVNMLLIPFGTLAQSQLRKNMQFKRLGGIELGSQLVHFLVAASFAFNDFGAISLAIASLCATITTLVLVNLLSTNRQKYSPRYSGVPEILPVVLTIGASNVVQSINGQAHPIIIGKAMSESAVAVLDKGLAVITLLNQAVLNGIQAVLTPFFARMKKDPFQLESSYLNVVAYVTVIAWPFLFCMSFHAEFIVLLLFGTQWQEAALLVPTLCVGSALATTDRYFNDFLLNVGLEKVVLKLNVFVLVLKVAALIFCSSYGLLFVVKGFVLVSGVRLFATTIILRSFGDVSVKKLSFVLIRSSVITLFSIIPFVPIILLDIQLQSFLYVLGHSVLVVVFWVVGTFLFKHIISKEILNIYVKFVKNGSL